MSLQIPTISELQTSIRSDLRTKLSVNTIVGKIVLNAFALVQAAKLKIYYYSLSFVYKNVFPDQADPASLGGTLERFGLIKLNRLPFPPTAGQYNVTVTGSIGGVIPANTTFKSLDTSTSPNKLYVIDTLFTLTATSETISLRALDLGTEALLINADQLQVTQPITNVDSLATVISATVIPEDGETTAQYREKVIQAYQTEPQGGARSDYKFIWSIDVSAVRTSYPYTNSPSIIDLYVEANPEDSIPVGSGIPTASTLTEVEAVVEFDPDTTKPLSERGRRPMGAWQINFLPVVPLDVDIDIVSLSDPSLLTSIESAIESFLFDIRPQIDGADNPNNAQNDLLYETDIYGIVRDTIGSSATFTSLTVEVDGTPITIYEFTGGNIPLLNNVTLS